MGRLVIISNRLPTIVSWEGDEFRFKETAGGLTSGLGAWLERKKAAGRPFIWIGWPGASVPEEQQENVRQALFERHSAVPVFLSEAAMDKFYLGFCNRTIWPLFHYFPSYVVIDTAAWDMYRTVNQTFMQAVHSVLQPGDEVWIHDYHLMLLPDLLRQAFPHIPIGFFLHIPFPSFEIYRLLPQRWRSDILTGLLGADLVGFHTHDYSEHFKRCVRRMLGYESRLGTIALPARTVRADTFPMGIDYQLFSDTAGSPAVEEEAGKLAASLAGLKTILSVDRLDYSKGIPRRLAAYRRFLELHPEWHGKVVLSAVVVPSRIGVEQYQKMKRQIDQLVGDINGRFGTVGWTPIRYQFRMLTSIPLSALYRVSDVCLVTPLRDGMNLVAKEYVASRLDGTGTLVLSEMAGAATELSEALIVNPNSLDDMAEALQQALTMSPDEQVARNRAMQQRLRHFTVHWWAQDFLRVLEASRIENVLQTRSWLTPERRDELLAAFCSARRRLIFLDYDGTLVPFYPHPDQARPGQRLLELLQELARVAQVMVISGRNKSSLETWFTGLPLHLAAEHGAWQRHPDGPWRQPVPVHADWKERLRPILESHADRLSGAFVEEKDASLVWHYRNADPGLAALRTSELLDTLTTLVANIDVQVLQGNKNVEVRTGSIHKGAVAERTLAGDPFDFVLAVGDDWTDEDLFRALPDSAWTVKVGHTQTVARFSVASQAEVPVLLERLVSACRVGVR